MTLRLMSQKTKRCKATVSRKKRTVQASRSESLQPSPKTRWSDVSAPSSLSKPFETMTWMLYDRVDPAFWEGRPRFLQAERE